MMSLGCVCRMRVTNNSQCRAGVVMLWMSIGLSAAAAAAPPLLYEQPAHQSPVRADPDDLLFLPGLGLGQDDTVVFRRLEDSTAPLTAPASVPSTTTAAAGIMPIVSHLDTPYSLTARLPAQMESGSTYALWVRNPKSGWSNGIRINDARPLWITPAYAYSTQSLAQLPRYLKVVGRNLQPAPGSTTRVQLAGPRTYTLEAADDDDAATAIERYAAKVQLPSAMPPGDYTVHVSRDGVSWVELAEQRFVVKPDAKTSQEFPVQTRSFGNCRPNDGADDTECVVKAIAAARHIGGGTVVFGPGTWNLIDGKTPGVANGDGIVVPRAVNLKGAGANQTTLLRDAKWDVASTNATFTLQGRNVVEGITFADAGRYQGPESKPSPFLQLGKAYYRANPRDAKEPRTVEDVVISGNVFDKPRYAVTSGGLPIKYLFVTHNTFGAFHTGLAVGADRANVNMPFYFEDSVIAGNTFKPGSYLDVKNGQGAMATVIGASRRLDFSNNVADGASAEYLYSPDDARGWRAAFFFHLSGNHEMLLVAQNTATCAGDKAGDGEAIAYDNNANAFGFPRAQDILDTTADTVTTASVLSTTQHGRSVEPENYYAGHWIQIVEGPGQGQVRPITGLASTHGDAQMAFTVSPPWDVPPVRGASRVSVARQMWQVYTVDNFIDHRQPLCRKSNRNGPEGGRITLWSQMADSVVEGNNQYDSDGITLNQSYSAEQKGCAACRSVTSLHSNIEVRGNVIDGEYDWNSDCSHSGIFVSHSAGSSADSPPPIAGWGVSIAHNSITHADGFRGGAITVPLTWLKGPWPHDWKVVNNLIIQHNSIRDIDGPPPSKRCERGQTGRVGINLFDASLVWRTVLYGNKCTNVQKRLNDTAHNTVRACPPGSSNRDSCECSR